MATAHLNAMHVKYKGKLPCALTFSFARAIQQPAMELWKGKDENVEAAQKMLYHRASFDNAARRGESIRRIWRRFLFDRNAVQIEISGDILDFV